MIWLVVNGRRDHPFTAKRRELSMFFPQVLYFAKYTKVERVVLNTLTHRLRRSRSASARRSDGSYRSCGSCDKEQRTKNTPPSQRRKRGRSVWVWICDHRIAGALIWLVVNGRRDHPFTARRGELSMFFPQVLYFAGSASARSRRDQGILAGGASHR